MTWKRPHEGGAPEAATTAKQRQARRHLTVAGRHPQQLRLSEPDISSQLPAGGKFYGADDMALVLDTLHRPVHWWLRTWEGRHQLAFIQRRDAA